MKLVITIRNFPEGDYFLNKIKFALHRIWKIDFGRDVDDIEIKEQN